MISCAGQKSKEYSNVAGSMVVDWNVKKDRVVPKIDEEATLGNEYGPVSRDNEQDKVIEKAELPMALLLGPGGYRTLSYLSLLKELHLRGETPHVLIGHGLGAVMAAYYAFGYKPDYIEWKIFKFTKKAENIEIYSDDWLELVEEELIDDLIGKKIEQGKLTLVIPVYDKKLGKVVYLKRGKLNDFLMVNIDLLNKRTSPYSTAFHTEVINKKILNDLGVGRIMIIDLLKNGINWKKGRGLLNGYFQKSAQLIDELKIENKIIMEYPLGKYPIDDLEDSAGLLYKSKAISRQKISEWILSKSKKESP